MFKKIMIGLATVVALSAYAPMDAVARGEVDAGAIWLSDVDRLLQTQTLAINALTDATPDRPLRWNMAIGVRRADAGLRASVNRASADLLAEGRLKPIFDRYRLPFFPPFTDH